MPWPGELAASASYIVPASFSQLRELLTAWSEEHGRDAFPIDPHRPPPADLPDLPPTASGPYRLRVQNDGDGLSGFGRAPASKLPGVITHPDCPDGCPDHPAADAVILVVESIPALNDGSETELWIECYQSAALSLYDDLTARVLQHWPAPSTRALHTWRHPACSPRSEVAASATFTISRASVRDLAGSGGPNPDGWFPRHTTEGKRIELFRPRLASGPLRLYIAWQPRNESVRFVGPDSDRLTPPPGITRVRLEGNVSPIPVTSDELIGLWATIPDIVVFDLERLADNRTKVYARCYDALAVPHFHQLLRDLQTDYPDIRWHEGEPMAASTSEDERPAADLVASRTFLVNDPPSVFEGWLTDHTFRAGYEGIRMKSGERLYFRRATTRASNPGYYYIEGDPSRTTVDLRPYGGWGFDHVITFAVKQGPEQSTEVLAKCLDPIALPFFDALLAAIQTRWRNIRWLDAWPRNSSSDTGSVDPSEEGAFPASTGENHGTSSRPTAQAGAKLAVPSRSLWLNRWRNAWRLAKPHWQQGKMDYKQIAEWLSRTHPTLAITSADTVAKIIKAGEAGLLTPPTSDNS